MIIKSPELVTNPLITVSVLTYNQKHCIGRCLDGILSQKISAPFNIVVADDCSTDGEMELLLDYQKRYPDKFILLFQEKNTRGTRNSIDAYELCKMGGGWNLYRGLRRG